MYELETQAKLKVGGNYCHPTLHTQTKRLTQQAGHTLKMHVYAFLEGVHQRKITL